LKTKRRPQKTAEVRLTVDVEDDALDGLALAAVARHGVAVIEVRVRVEAPRASLA